MSALYGTDAQFSRAQGSYDRQAPADDPLWDEACDHVWKLDGMALHRAQENFMLDHPEIYFEFEEYERRRKYAQLTKNAEAA